MTRNLRQLSRRICVAEGEKLSYAGLCVITELDRSLKLLLPEHEDKSAFNPLNFFELSRAVKAMHYSGR